MNEEEQLRMALEASLQEDTCAPSGSMGLIVETLRSCVHERQDKHKLSSEIEGVVMVSVLNNFFSSRDEFISVDVCSNTIQ